MQDRWDTDRAGDDPVDQCVYCSRLIGADPDLVLHGGGNSSVKVSWPDIGGRTVDALRVKGSGWDMGTLEAPGLTPLRLDRLGELLALDELRDRDMMRELAAARLDPAAPNPSVESLLHAYLPHRAVQHSHADVIVNITNLGDPEAVAREIYGDRVVVVPYVMPGFDLARLVREVWPTQAHDATVGMVLCNHGLFTFGDDSATAYRRHVELITLAEHWLAREAPQAATGTPPPAVEVLATDLAELRRTLSEVVGAPVVVQRHTDEVVRRFVARPDLASVADRGPLTPDHVIRTKRVPMVGRDVGAYTEAYRAYVDEHRHRARGELVELDPAPRVVLDPAWGMLTVGRTAKDATIAADIYHHTMAVVARAEDHLGGYVALEPAHLFDVEYWELEQAKLTRAGAPPELAGTVALVTGAASGIGRACVDELLGRGAAVVGLDRDERVVDAAAGPAWLGVTADVTDPEAQRRAVQVAVERFGGVDIAVVSAGSFSGLGPIAERDAAAWRSTFALNVDAVADLLARLHGVLRLSPVGGRVVVIGSKNVPAPGPGAAAYSASKAAVTQLARVAALEWAPDRIRVNVVHPDAVFDTALWTDEMLAARAARYDMTVAEYKRRNLLGVEVTAAGVARAVVALCGDAFAGTTGAQIPIDGGNDRVV
jgi:rhamnose utilization protein RhaD (predicted bifunctional aldolase and dehydrogenase)/NAD(P)-dependent dehydrogenase (short-subunit alcohol dehydrogenase family)